MHRSIADRPLFWAVMVAILIALAGAVVARSDPAPLSDEKAVRYDLRVLLGHDPSDVELSDYLGAYPGAVALGRETVKLDWIEHETPTVEVPGMVAVLKGRDLVYGFQSPLTLTVAAPAPGDPPVLRYDVTLRDGTMPGFAPPDRSSAVIFWQVVSAVALFGGVLIGHAVK